MKRGRESKKQEEGRKKIWKKSYNHLEADKAFIFFSKEEGRRKKREGRRKKEGKRGDKQARPGDWICGSCGDLLSRNGSAQRRRFRSALKTTTILKQTRLSFFFSKEKGRRKKREGRRKKERKGKTNKRDQVIGSAVLAATSNSRGTQHVGSLFWKFGR